MKAYALLSVFVCLCCPELTFAADPTDVELVELDRMISSFDPATSTLRTFVDRMGDEASLHALRRIAHSGNETVSLWVARPKLLKLTRSGSVPAWKLADIAEALLPVTDAYFEKELLEIMASSPKTATRAEAIAKQGYQQWVAAGREGRCYYMDLMLAFRWEGWLDVLEENTGAECPPTRIRDVLASLQAAATMGEHRQIIAVLVMLMDDTRPIPHSVYSVSECALVHAVWRYPILRADLALRLERGASTQERVCCAKEWLKEHADNRSKVIPEKGLTAFFQDFDEMPVAESARWLDGCLGRDFSLSSVAALSANDPARVRLMDSIRDWWAVNREKPYDELAASAKEQAAKLHQEHGNSIHQSRLNAIARRANERREIHDARSRLKRADSLYEKSRTPAMPESSREVHMLRAYESYKRYLDSNLGDPDTARARQRIAELEEKLKRGGVSFPLPAPVIVNEPVPTSNIEPSQHGIHDYPPKREKLPVESRSDVGRKRNGDQIIQRTRVETETGRTIDTTQEVPEDGVLSAEAQPERVERGAATMRPGWPEAVWIVCLGTVLLGLVWGLRIAQHPTPK